jgi:hypothetical protein
MYATIEPRLIALLNDSTSEPFTYPRLDLPPLPTILKAAGRPSPLEPNASPRSNKDSPIGAQQTGLFDREVASSATARISDGKDVPNDLAQGASPQSLQKILVNNPEASQSSSPKKRQRTESSKDDFVQLPQPPKKQKAAKQVVPPIIIGLFEPPPNAALFPPISSSSFHDSHGRNSLNIGPPNDRKDAAVSAKNEPNSNVRSNAEAKESKKPGVKVRKKWTEDETNQLLLAVARHGIGNWTKILQDSEFKFDNRRAVDLKDRFRTCCPAELRGNAKASSSIHHEDGYPSGNPRPKSSLMSENILVDSGYLSSDCSSTEDKNSSAPNKGLTKSRAHRKKLEDLAELGIKEPFKRSKRRERRPFSEEEDRNILQGFYDYGPAWTRISKDPRFGLETRRPTDLRDRLRNKYPEKYFFEEDSRNFTKESCPQTSEVSAISNEAKSALKASSAIMNHTSSISLHSQTLEVLPCFQDQKAGSKGLSQTPTHVSIFPFKDTFSELLEQPSASDSDPLSYSQSLDWTDNMSSFSSIGVLDETWTSSLSNLSGIPNLNAKQRQSYTHISSICAAPAQSQQQFLSIYGMTTCEASQTVNLPPPAIKDLGLGLG